MASITLTDEQWDKLKNDMDAKIEMLSKEESEQLKLVIFSKLNS